MLSLAFSAFCAFAVGAEEASTALSQFREMASTYLEKAAEPRELYSIGEEIARLYFREASDSERVQLEAELGAILRAHRKLGPTFIPLGNAFQSEAKILNNALQADIKKIRLIAAGATALVGVVILRGAFQLKYIPPSLVEYKTLTLIGGGLAAAGLGYFVFGTTATWALLPYDEAAETADDFLDRYPQGIDFLKATADPTWQDPLDALSDD